MVFCFVAFVSAYCDKYDAVNNLGFINLSSFILPSFSNMENEQYLPIIRN